MLITDITVNSNMNLWILLILALSLFWLGLTSLICLIIQKFMDFTVDFTIGVLNTVHPVD